MLWNTLWTNNEIQVLDDSTDGSHIIAKGLVQEYRAKGYDITLVRRFHRKNFKAGALNYGMERAKGEFLSIFDADFVPPQNYLLQTVPFLKKNSKIALVQARWGHLNPEESLLTLSQSIGIDGHFIIEQSARSWGKFFMNFNGTAGVWRKEAIKAAGGWQGDTLTEDMDLSYRAQILGWKMKFLYDLVVPAELPSNMNAFKTQQYRWAKGSIQTAMKLLPTILKSKESFWIKLQSLLHITHYMIHPLMLITALLAVPLLLYYPLSISGWLFASLCTLIVLASLAPSTLYLVAQKVSNISWKKRIRVVPVLMFVGVGLSFNNTLAILSAWNGHKGTFVRTPKLGDRSIKKYRSKWPFTSLLELGLALYCFLGFGVYLETQKYIVTPFIGLYGIGFLTVGFFSIYHHLKSGYGLFSKEV